MIGEDGAVFRKLIDRVAGLGDHPRPGVAPTGDPARGVVVYYYGDEPELGVSKQWWWRTVDVALADDPQQVVARVEVYLTKAAYQRLRVGTEVPVRVEPGTRTIIGIDAEAFEHEIESGAAEAAPDVPPPPAVSASEAGPVSLPPEAEQEVLEGVDFDTWVRVEARLAARPVAPQEHDAVAASEGVAAGTWAAAQAAWQARLRSDWQLAARFGAAYDEALRNQLR